MVAQVLIAENEGSLKILLFLLSAIQKVYSGFIKELIAREYGRIYDRFTHCLELTDEKSEGLRHQAEPRRPYRIV